MIDTVTAPSLALEFERLGVVIHILDLYSYTGHAPDAVGPGAITDLPTCIAIASSLPGVILFLIEPNLARSLGSAL
jgi:hypothetical protein